MTLLCIGDSNTFGYDPHSYFGSRYPAEVRWTDRLTGWKVINCGINGLTVPAESSAFTDLIRNKAPDLVTVMLGCNDLLAGESAEKTASRMEAFLTAVRETGTQVLLIAAPHMQPGEWVRSESLIEASRKLKDLYREIADREGILFADAGEWNVEMTFDGVHFSSAGHEAFAKGLEERLKEVANDDDIEETY